MKTELRNNRRFLSGVMFIGIGALAMYVAQDYPMGSALRISRGDPSVFVTRPISLGFVIATVLIVIVMWLPAVRQRREAITD